MSEKKIIMTAEKSYKMISERNASIAITEKSDDYKRNWWTKLFKTESYKKLSQILNDSKTFECTSSTYLKKEESFVKIIVDLNSTVFCLT